MSHSHRKKFRDSIVTLLIVAFVGGAGYMGWRLTKADPMRSFKTAQEPANAIQMKEVKFTSYNEKGELKTEADVNKMDVTKDRVTVNLSKVTNGKFFVDKDNTLEYSMSLATYYPPMERLIGTGEINLKGKDFDLKTENVTYDGIENVMNINTPVKGKFGPGEIEAKTLRYNVKSLQGVAFRVSWKGKIQSNDVPVAKAQSTWNISAERTDLRNKIYIHTNARATDGEVIVLAQRVEQNTETQVITCTGNVRYFGMDANVSCQRAVIYRKERRAVFTGEVNMLVKPTDSPAPKEELIPPLAPVVPDEIARIRPPASDDPVVVDRVRDANKLRAYPIAVRAGQIEYWYQKGKRRAVITGAPQARQAIDDQSWRMVWAPLAEYDGEKEILTLKSTGTGRQVRFLNSIGDDLSAAQIEVSTKDGDDRMSAKDLVGTLPIDEDELPPPTTGGGTGGTPPSISGPIGRA